MVIQCPIIGCWRKEKESQTQKTLVGLIYCKKSALATGKPVLLPVETHVVPKPLEMFQGDVYKSFVSEGSVSPVGVTETE